MTKSIHPNSEDAVARYRRTERSGAARKRRMNNKQEPIEPLPAPNGSAIPRRPWVLSKQYSMTFVLSQDNDIIIPDSTCKYLGDDVLRHIIAAVNAYSPNDPNSATAED